MSTKKRAAAALGLSFALLLAGATSAVADKGKTPASTPPPLKQTTMDDLSTAMHGEAFAYASYTTFAQVASPKGKTSLSKLFSSTAEVELTDHLAMEASLSGLVKSPTENLQTAIAGENYETTTMYPQFAQAAYAAGDTEAGDLFTQIGADEATHRDGFTQALPAVSSPKNKAPKGPTADDVPIQTGGGSTLSDTTRANLLAAMHGEAFAYASYMLYADQAQRAGLPSVAQLFRATATVELTEHFREEGNLLGLAGTNAANLTTAINGEQYESTTMYPQFAINAINAGDYTVAQAFLEIRGDEADHAAAYTAALAQNH